MSRPRPPHPMRYKQLPANVDFTMNAKAFIRGVMKSNGYDWETLSARLYGIVDIEITPKGLENKISRGGFSAAFLMQCLCAMDMWISAEPLDLEGL